GERGTLPPARRRGAGPAMADPRVKPPADRGRCGVSLTPAAAARRATADRLAALSARPDNTSCSDRAPRFSFPQEDRSMKRFVSCLAVAAGLWLSAVPAGGADVKEGQPAPNVELPVTQIEKALPDKKDAKTLKLADLRGKNVVVYFFPKALTKG